MNPILGMFGAVVAPHSLAAQAGLDILREGGNTIEATMAVASTLAVVYLHMTGIGGDVFGLMHPPGSALLAACHLDGMAAAGRLDWPVRDRHPQAKATPPGWASRPQMGAR